MGEKTPESFTTKAISLSECKRLYPENNGLDGEVVYQLAFQFGSLSFAEKLISLCDCDFFLAEKLGKLAKENELVYHGNIYLLERLFTLFSKDLSAAFVFVNCFDSSITSTSSSTTTSSSITLALRSLSRFDNDVTKARKFLELFKYQGAIAYSFLSRFNHANDTTKLLGFFSNGLDANEFIERFDKTVDALSFLSSFQNEVSGAKKFLNCFDDGTSATKFLSRFNNNVSTANTFLSYFKDGTSADTFLKEFELNNSATAFLSQFNNNGSSAISFLSHFDDNVERAEQSLNEDPSFKFAFCGCNGDIAAVETFKDLTAIKIPNEKPQLITLLELLYDSEQHSHNAQEFHSRCDEKGQTVTFICANGICVCGVVKSSWSSQDSGSGNGKKDDSAYLLRLSPYPQKITQKIPQKCKVSGNLSSSALNCYAKYGPSFGNDLTIEFPNGSPSIIGTINHRQSYNLPEGFFGKNKNNMFTVDRLVVCRY